MFLVPCCFLKFSFHVYLYLASCFYLLFPCLFLFPSHCRIFPRPLSSLYLLVLLVPSTSLPCLSYLSLHLSVPVFLCNLSALLSLYTVVLLLFPLLFTAPCFLALCPTPPLRPSVLPPAFLFPFLPLSCCLWALSLVASSLLGFLMCLKE